MRKLTFILITCFCLMSFPARAQGVSGDLLSRINSLRAELGLAPYSLNSALNAAALNQAEWMVTTSRVSHTQENGSNPQSRAQANGYNSQWVSENIYMGGLASTDTAWNFWLNSEIHYAGLTSPNYQNIGIATAQGQGGQSFVLVFGVPSGASTTSSGNSTSSSDNQTAATVPLAIIGYDEVGNIQYQLQAGDTLGQVLLLFGYTWDDLNTLLELNQFTEADITALEVGQVVLVPPPQGTYTPTPIIEAIEEVVVDLTATPLAINNSQTDAIIPTLAPDLVSIEATEEVIIEELGQAVTFIAVTASATIALSATPIPTLSVNMLATPTTSATPIIENAPVNNNSSNPPAWLIVAIIVQIAVLAYASFEFFRRKS